MEYTVCMLLKMLLTALNEAGILGEREKIGEKRVKNGESNATHFSYFTF